MVPAAALLDMVLCGAKAAWTRKLCSWVTMGDAPRFREYADMVDSRVALRHGAVPHWAKVEVPEHPGAALTGNIIQNNLTASQHWKHESKTVPPEL